MAYQRIEVRPYSSAIGAEILGVDLSQSLDNHTWSEIHQAFLEHLVVFFRDQHLTPEQHIAFSRRFGDLEPFPFADGIDGHPEIVEVVKLPDELHNFGSGWHTDMSFREKPPLAAALYSIEVPPAGGDTLFANMYLAYETLSDGMKDLLKRLRGVHNSHLDSGQVYTIKGMKMHMDDHPTEVYAHPLTRVHPDTGKASLFLSPDYCEQLEDMTVEESRTILDPLERHATRHEFACRFRWEPNSLAVWDNRCAMHHAIEDDLGARREGRGFKRVMRRSTIRS